MGSLYEPSVRSSIWSLRASGVSKRFTTLEGWREIGLGVYAMGNSNIRMFSIRNQYDPEHFRDNRNVQFEFQVSRRTQPLKSRLFAVEYQRPSEATTEKAVEPVQLAKGDVLQTETRELYNVYTKKEKWVIVAIIGAAGIFPALTFNIYLPALTRIATNLNISLETVHLSIASYLIVQGITPIFVVPLADTLGRRPVFIYSLVLYVAATVVLSFSPNFSILLVFRSLQAAAIASTVSIGCAVIQDVAPPWERDSFYSFYQGIRNGALLLAPILGGLTSNWANFRCLFIILFALSLLALITTLLFLPETLRSIAGDGTLPLTGIHKPLIRRCGFLGQPEHQDETAVPRQQPELKSKTFIEPFQLLRQPDIVLSLCFSSIIFAIWMMMTVSTTGLFQKTFNLKESVLGTAFLPNAIGTIVGSTLIGNLLNQDFLAACSVYHKTHSLPQSVIISRHSLPADFPLEHTRLMRLPGLVVLFTIALSIYGFTLYYPSLTSLGGWVAIPLFLQFLIAAMAHAICGVHQTLIADLWPWNGAAATTISNLVKSLLAGIGVAVVQEILSRIEAGPTFLALGLVTMVLVPLPIVQWYWGCGWRQVRDARLPHCSPSTQPEKVQV